MPSERFLKLPEEKKEKIAKAAMKEYCSVPLESVSINRIIKDAGISRGSFYTYFEDKQDVLNYLGEEMQRRNEETMKHCVEETGGDFFAALDLYRDEICCYLNKPHMFHIHKNLAIHSNINPLHVLEHRESGKAIRFAAWIYEHVDTEKLNVHSAEEMLSLLMLCYMSLMVNVIEICLNPDSEEDALKFYRRRMKFLKEGALKHE